MRRGLAGAIVIVAVTGAVSARYAAQTPPSAVRFNEFSPTTVSVVVRDVEKTARAWAEVLGISVPRIVEPEVVYPPMFEGDRSGRPKMTSMQMANLNVSLHQPPAGKTYWRELLDTHGELLYRMNFSVHDLADQTTYFEQKGGTLTIGDPAKVPYVNVNLWSRYGFALELNGLAASQDASQTSRPAIDATAFANNPVFKIAFVVPDLDKAVADYADLLGISSAGATRGRRLVGRDGSTSAQAATIDTATLQFPNGMLLELNQPRGGESIWWTHLQKHGQSIFSIGFHVKSVREQIAYLTGTGGTLVFGDASTPYAYFDFTSRLGTIIDLVETTP